MNAKLRAKVCVWAVLACALFAGCATNTIEKRRQERAPAYAALPPEFRANVDQGRIKIGMTMDAVYIAWGKPSQVLTGESTPGVVSVTWLYQGSIIREYYYWSYWYSRGRYGYFPTPYLATDYYPSYYMKAEVVFENGLVKEWRSLPKPPR